MIGKDRGVDAILTINAGSSSLKFAVYRLGSDQTEIRADLHGQIEGIGTAPHLVMRDPDGKTVSEIRWPADAEHDYDHLLESLLRDLESRLDGSRLRMVGHRVVHGGTRYAAPVLVANEVLAELERLTPLAPLHQHHNLAPIRALARVRPTVPQLACFDTAFHQTMPAVATTMALPRALREAGLRRYGFHGLSYEFIVRRLRVVAPEIADRRLVIAHLGNGASLCALDRGHSVDTTMGLTGLDGLVMGTRTGAIDPGALLYLLQARGMTPPELEDLLYRRAGLLGISGISSDMRTLLASDDPHAAEAVALFVFRAAREIAALATGLGGIDGIVFTAGIGENAPEIRERIIARLAWLGAEIEPEANAASRFVISTPRSKIDIRILPTDEEAMIGLHCLEHLAAAAPIAEACRS